MRHITSRTLALSIALVAALPSAADAAVTRSRPHFRPAAQVTTGGWTVGDMNAWRAIAQRMGVNPQQVADARLAAQWQAVADRMHVTGAVSAKQAADAALAAQWQAVADHLKQAGATPPGSSITY